MTEATTDDLLLRKLKPIMEASYSEYKLCFEGSRIDTLRAIEKWSGNKSGPKVFWLYGSTGLGKTRVAHTVAKLFRDQNRLAGYFFPVTEISSEKVMPTIAYQIAKWHADYRSNILDILRGREELDLYSGFSSQFELLMKRPILEMSICSPPGHQPLILVLDALENLCDPESCNRSFVDYIMDSATLVPWLKVFVTSRSLSITRNRSRKHRVVVQHLSMDDPLLDLHHDIAVYARLCESRRESPKEWTPGMISDVRGLLTRISKTFDASNAIQNGEMIGPITEVWEVEGVFLSLSRSVLAKIRDDDVPTTRSILAIMSCLASVHAPKEEVLFHFLHSIHPEITQDYLHNVIARLVPIVRYTSEHTLQVLFPPTVFSAFFSDRQESTFFHMDMEWLKHQLAQCSIEFLLANLKFNICGLDMPRLRNEEVPDTTERISVHLSPTLHYCSMYWMDLAAQSEASKLYDTVANFLCSRKALFWLEVMSLLGKLDLGKDILLKCLDHFEVSSCLFFLCCVIYAQQHGNRETSYSPVL